MSRRKRCVIFVIWSSLIYFIFAKLRHGRRGGVVNTHQYGSLIVPRQQGRYVCGARYQIVDIVAILGDIAYRLAGCDKARAGTATGGGVNRTGNDHSTRYTAPHIEVACEPLDLPFLVRNSVPGSQDPVVFFGRIFSFLRQHP